MTHRVGHKGQVVIPNAFRKAVSLEPGDEVTFSRDGNAIRVERVASPDALMGCLAGHLLVEALERDRRPERRRSWRETVAPTASIRGRCFDSSRTIPRPRDRC
jgi:AbrB family looped-hinge helix DNA binding protein